MGKRLEEKLQMCKEQVKDLEEANFKLLQDNKILDNENKSVI